MKTLLLLSLLHDSPILDYFWLGDDGVDCGEPTVERIVLDEVSQKLTFTIHPMAQNYSCEMRSMECVVNYSLDESGILELEQEVLTPFNGCSI